MNIQQLLLGLSNYVRPTSELTQHPQFEELQKAIEKDDCKKAQELLMNFSLLNDGLLEYMVTKKISETSRASLNSYFETLMQIKSPQMLYILLAAGLPPTHLFGQSFTNLDLTPHYQTYALNLMLCPALMLDENIISQEDVITYEKMQFPVGFGNLNYDLFTLFAGFIRSGFSMNIGYINEPLYKHFDDLECRIDFFEEANDKVSKEIMPKRINEHLKKEIRTLNKKLKSEGIYKNTIQKENEEHKDLANNLKKTIEEARERYLYSFWMRAVIFCGIAPFFILFFWTKILGQEEKYRDSSLMINEFNIIGLACRRLISLSCLSLTLKNESVARKLDALKRKLSDSSVENTLVVDPFEWVFGIVFNLMAYVPYINKPFPHLQRIETAVEKHSEMLVAFRKATQSLIISDMLQSSQTFDFIKALPNLKNDLRKRFNDEWSKPAKDRPKTLMFWKQVFDQSNSSANVEHAGAANNIRVNNKPALSF